MALCIVRHVSTLKLIRRVRCPLEYPCTMSVVVRRLHPFEVDTNVQRDVTLFKYENARFYRILNLFALSQLVFWSYMSYFVYTSLRDVDKPQQRQPQQALADATMDESEEVDVEQASWWRKVNLGDGRFRTGFSVLCATIGSTVFFGAFFFTRRSVRSLTLLRGGSSVRLKCYSPWTLRDRIVEVPLDHLNCFYTRGQRGHLPIEVFGHRFYFLLDNDGEFTNTKLFDYTAGLHRSWSK